MFPSKNKSTQELLHHITNISNNENLSKIDRFTRFQLKKQREKDKFKHTSSQNLSYDFCSKLKIRKKKSNKNTSIAYFPYLT